jgi:hypothetical protein
LIKLSISFQSLATPVGTAALPCVARCRRLFGLPPATSFRNITPDATLAAKLEQLYGGNINNVDAYVGGLAEPHFSNAHVGQLFYASIFDQFKRLRDGDWYYFKNADNGLFNAQEVAEIESTGGVLSYERTIDVLGLLLVRIFSQKQ